jgi:hypothetical protein
MLEDIENVVVVHFDEHGSIDYALCGDGLRLFIVDERARNDERVYEWTTRCTAGTIRELIPADSKRGHKGDMRHAAIKHRVEAMQRGESHIKPIK